MKIPQCLVVAAVALPLAAGLLAAQAAPPGNVAAVGEVTAGAPSRGPVVTARGGRRGGTPAPVKPATPPLKDNVTLAIQSDLPNIPPANFTWTGVGPQFQDDRQAPAPWGGFHISLSGNVTQDGDTYAVAVRYTVMYWASLLAGPLPPEQEHTINQVAAIGVVQLKVGETATMVAINGKKFTVSLTMPKP